MLSRLRACGSPPSAVELLRRHTGEDFAAALAQVLLEWDGGVVPRAR